MSDKRSPGDLSEQEVENARRYEAIHNHTVFAVFISDLNGVILEANQRAKQLTGYTDEDIETGLDFDSIIAFPQIARRLKEDRELVLQDGKREAQEYPIKCKDGSVIWVEAESCVLYRNGKPYAFLGIGHEVTRRKEREKWIQNEKERTLKILDRIPNLIYIFSLKHSQTVFLNRALVAYMGYSIEETRYLGSHVFENLMHPEDQPGIHEHNRSLYDLNDDESAEIEFRMRSKNGDWRWFRNTHVAFSRESDGTVREVLGSAVDITERKAREDALRESEENLRITLSSIGDGVITTETEGKILRMNSMAEKLTGWKIDEAKGRLLKDVFSIHNALTGETVDNPVSKVLSSGLIVGLANHTTLVSRNGEEYNISDSAAPVKDGQGNIRGVVLAFSDKTREYNLQQQIWKTKERLELALDATEMGTWDWDITTDQIIYDKRWADIVGYAPEELEPNMNTYNNMIHPEDKSFVFRKIREHLTGETPAFHIEHRFQKKSGEYIWTLSRGRVIERDQNNKPLRACGTMLDITKRKTAQEMLRLSEERYRTYIRFTSDGIYRIEMSEPIPENISPDLQVGLFYERARVAEANQAFARMYGFESEEEIKDKTLTEFHGGTNKRENRLFFHAFARSNYRVTNFISDEVDVNGNQHFFLNNVFGIVEDGKLVRVWGTQRDVTELRRTQMAEEQYLREITKQKQFIQKIFDTNPNVLYVYDLQAQTPLFQNRHVAMAIGYSENQVLEMRNSILQKLMYPGDVPKVSAHFKKLESASDNEILNAEYRMKDSSGNWHWFISYDTPFERDENGKVIQIIGTATDITEFKRAQADLTQYQHKLEKANRELTELNSNLQNANQRLMSIDKVKTEFVSMASHELRTPITSVLGFAQTLQSPDISLDRKESRHYLKIIEKEAIRLRDLVSDLLDLSKIESGRTEFRHEQVDLEELVKNALEYLRVSPEKRISVKSDEWGRRPVLGDRDKIRRVILNIIENSLRYADRIEVKISGEPRQRMVEIRDNGPGIAPRHQKKVFEKFYRVQEEKAPGTGSGLGLAIAKEIVQSHGGRIWVESTPGEGASFFFTIKD
ncbi:MAG: PAS domain S-box protein [Chitinispirillaceae bacterium]